MEYTKLLAARSVQGNYETKITRGTGAKGIAHGELENALSKKRSQNKVWMEISTFFPLSYKN